ncbi:EpsG family protein [Streptococcus sp. E29BA]|uniref:EpsG family protein n=1 Tax=Streptococcus sp. E29BA TaxID=3278716 RepID=UPI00359EAEA7
MTSRYGQMLLWGIQFTIFSLLVIGLYLVLDRAFPKIIFRLRYAKIGTIYLSDFFCLIILVVIVGIRTNSGSDYYNYLLAFKSIDSWFYSLREIVDARFQNGLYTLMYVIKKINPSEVVFFIFYGLLNYIPVFYMIRKYSKHAVLSLMSWIFLGFFLMSTNILKQSLAMSLILLAFHQWQSKKYIIFSILSILACWFHLSSLAVIIGILIVNHIKPSKNFLYLMGTIGLSLLLFLQPILIVISKVLRIRYIDVYISSFLQQGSTEFKLQVAALIILMIYVLILFHLTRPDVLTRFSTVHLRMLGLCLLMIPFLILSIRFYIFNRLAFTGLQFIIFLIPYIQKPRQRLFYISLIFAGFWISILNADNNYYNYSTVFNDTPVSIQEFVRRD